MKLNIKLESDWLEATWLENDKQIYCESFSGHKEHIALLRAKAKEFNTPLSKFEDLIKQCQDSFVYPTDEEIKLQKQANFRAERNNLLNLVDIEINKAEDLGQDTTILRSYRQALRGATKDWILPESVL